MGEKSNRGGGGKGRKIGGDNERPEEVGDQKRTSEREEDRREF